MRRGTPRAGGGGVKNLSNWRSVRLWESSVEQQLHQRHTFWLHGVCIGLVTLAVTWGASHVQMRWGVESLALRYLVSLSLGFLAYLLMLRLWAGVLVRKLRDPEKSAQSRDWGHADMGWPGGSSGGPGSASAQLPPLQAGGGGNFGGGGASGDFAGAADAMNAADTGNGMGDMASGAFEAAGSADEAAVVVIPVVAVFVIGCAVFFGAGSLLLAYFGWEALLAVAVELAFSYASARVAVRVVRVVREGWLSAALRLTWKPLFGAVACAVILGVAIDYFVPAAHSLPQAIKLLRAPAR